MTSLARLLCRRCSSQIPYGMFRRWACNPNQDTNGPFDRPTHDPNSVWNPAPNLRTLCSRKRRQDHMHDDLVNHVHGDTKTSALEAFRPGVRSTASARIFTGLRHVILAIHKVRFTRRCVTARLHAEAHRLSPPTISPPAMQLD